ncbi:MAG: alpha/beta fold hydrolase [Polaromonas sp.]|uniref:RBBP9/YdeN family alpha/beta hydrolase n=1 Tax=Polaromonas sp. TaxID=1869339 RepID=UPI0027328CB0|nr:alpha/beta fold hydrolase [Polaromonas sp.]MDP2817401.1 alpha/beta fold hydrolase [Polaromonas sp.]
MSPAHTLILPGWQSSGPGHWQSLWEAAHGYQRVEQHDWLRPLRGDWSARLEEVLLDTDAEGGGPAVLVAHSLGCMLAAAWAAHSRNTHRVKAALLVAPPDVERADVRQVLPGWAPVPLQALPFPALVLASSNDPFCDLARARGFAAAWGADFVDVGPCGHINADSGLGEWPQAHEHLKRLQTLRFPSREFCLSPSGNTLNKQAHAAKLTR